MSLSKIWNALFGPAVNAEGKTSAQLDQEYRARRAEQDAQIKEMGWDSYKAMKHSERPANKGNDFYIMPYVRR